MPLLGFKGENAREKVIVLLTMCFALAMAMLDNTVVNIALPTIGEDLDAGIASLQWVVNAYTLTLSGFLLLGGSLGDHYGRRRVFVFAGGGVAGTVQLFTSMTRLTSTATTGGLANPAVATAEADAEATYLGAVRALAAATRIGFGVTQALDSRYTSFSLYLSIAVIALFATPSRVSIS